MVAGELDGTLVGLGVLQYPELTNKLAVLGHVSGMRVLVSGMCIGATGSGSSLRGRLLDSRNPVLLAPITVLTSY